MTTAFALICERCGLSHREAATFLNVRLDTVKSWSSGRNRAGDGVIAELRALYERIDRAAAEMIATIEKARADHGLPDIIELGIASDDYESQSLGWPCVGAQAACLGIVTARIGLPVAIVPRGSTLASAAAADAPSP
jgi:hypothetical protein